MPNMSIQDLASIGALVVSVVTFVYSWWSARETDKKLQRIGVMERSNDVLKMIAEVTERYSKGYVAFEERIQSFYRRSLKLEDEANEIGAGDVRDDIKKTRDEFLHKHRKLTEENDSTHHSLLEKADFFFKFYNSPDSDEIKLRTALIGLHQMAVGASQVEWGSGKQVVGLEDMLLGWELGLQAARLRAAAARKRAAADAIAPQSSPS